MADLTIEQIVSFFQGLSPEKAQKAFDDLKDSAGTFQTVIGTTMTNVKDTTQSVGQVVLDTTKSITQAINGLDVSQATAGLGQLLNMAMRVNPALATMTGQLALIAAGVTRLPEPRGFDGFAKSAGGASDTLNDLGGTYADLNEILNVDNQGPIDQMIKLAQAASLNAQRARAFESSLLRSAAASGNFASLLGEVGTDLEGLGRKTEQQSLLFQQLGNEAGISASQMAEFAGQISLIPGALDMNIKGADKTEDSINMLSAALKVASGTGQNFSQVFDDLNKVYRNYGVTGKEALEYTARLSSASSALKMPLDIVKTYTSNASDAFRMFGNNTQGAITILGRLGPALQNSGLGPAAVADLVGNVTRSLAQMSLAEKAFLSQNTRGPGGLRGAYNIELALQKGDVDQVFNQVRESLNKQFNGRIVTLEQAAKSEDAAAQFTRQVAMLTSGPTKIAGSEAEAYKLLEAFAKGDKTPMPQIKTGEAALKDSMDLGNNIQKRQYDATIIMQNAVQRTAMLSAIQANTLAQMLVGFKANPVFANRLEDVRRRAQGEAAAIGKDEQGNRLRQGKEVSEVIQEFDFSSFMKENTEFLGAGIQSALEKVGESGEEIMKGSEPDIRISQPTQSERRVSQMMVADKKAEEQIIRPASRNQSADVTLKALCSKCTQEMPDQEKVLQLIDGKIEVYDAGKNIGVSTGVQRR